MRFYIPRKLTGSSFLFLLFLCMKGSAGKTIDEIIAGSSKQVTAFDFMGDQSGSMVRVELDMMMTVAQYQSLYVSKSQKSKKPLRNKRKAIKHLMYRWTNNEIPYSIDSGVFSADEIAEINRAIAEWRNYTCINFRQATSRDSNRIRFQDGSGCSSYVGMSGGQHPVVLAGGCRVKGVIAHEIGHAVGFYHEQNRPDRDDHIIVQTENIIHPSLEHNFQKYPWSAVDTYNVPYDYRSIMHYGSRAFSVNGQYTIKTRDPTMQDVIGNREGLSFNDIKLANLMYSCSERCDANIRCPNDGFVGKDCQCWCPGNPVQKCQGTEIKPTTKRPVVVSTVKPTTTASCADMNPYCADWARQGYCSTNNYVKTYCKKSCVLCEGPSTTSSQCRDVRPYCQYWKDQGYCSGGIYEGFMTEKCPVTCGVCRASSYSGSHKGMESGNSSAIRVLFSSLLMFVTCLSGFIL